MLSEEQVGLNLIECFGADIGSHKHFKAWRRVGSFLSDPSAVLKQMDSLDARMYEVLCQKRLPSIPLERSMVTTAYRSYYTEPDKGRTRSIGIEGTEASINKSVVSRLLSEVLTAREAEMDFKFETGDFQATGPDPLQDRTTAPSQHQRVSTYHGFVKPKPFQAQLKKRSHWKDPGAQATHGEFTHRLQWYAICGGLMTNVGEAASVFASIGEYAEAFASKTAKDVTLYLWDALCDRSNGIPNVVAFTDKEFVTEKSGEFGDDFRSPENLNTYLTAKEGEGPHRFPLLHDFLAARKAKREFDLKQAFGLMNPFNEQWTDPGIIFQRQYLSRKIYGCNYLDLIESRQRVVDHAMGESSDQILKF